MRTVIKITTKEYNLLSEDQREKVLDSMDECCRLNRAIEFKSLTHEERKSCKIQLDKLVKNTEKTIKDSDNNN